MPMSLAMGMPLDSGGSPWSPAFFGSACVLWLRGDAVNSSSGNISQATDKSGNGNHATQATGALQPTTGTAINSQPTIHFNGTTQFLNVPNMSVLASTAMSVCHVGKMTSAPGASTSYSPIILYDGSSHFKWQSFRNVGGYSTFDFQAWGEANGLGPTPTLDNSAHVWIWTVDAVGGSSSHYTANLDNSNQTVATSGVQSLSGDTPALGGIVSAGAISANGYPGDIAEVIVVTRQFTAGDLANLATYFTARYGIA